MVLKKSNLPMPLHVKEVLNVEEMREPFRS